MLDLDTLRTRVTDMITLVRTDITVKVVPELAGEERLISVAEMLEAAEKPMFSLAEICQCKHAAMVDSVTEIQSRPKDFEIAHALITGFNAISPELIKQLRRDATVALVEAVHAETDPVVSPMEAMLAGCIVGVVAGAGASTEPQ